MNDGLNPSNNNLGYNFDWGYDAQGNPRLNSMSMDMFLDEGASVRSSDTDWFKEITRTGVVQQYNLSVSNGNEKGNCFFSVGYYDNMGTIKDSHFSRLSGRANADYKLFDGKVVIGENFTVNRTKGVSAPGGILENALEFNPNFPIYAENGEFAQALGAYSERENPMSMLSNNKNNEYTQWRMFGDAHLSITPFKNFTIRTTLGMDYTQKQQRFFLYPIVNGKMKRTESAAESKQEHWMNWMWNAIATYNLEKDKHRGDAMVGVEVNRQNYNMSDAQRYELAILTTDYMWPSAGTGRQLATGFGNGYSLVSFFGKVNYTYDATHGVRPVTKRLTIPHATHSIRHWCLLISGTRTRLVPPTTSRVRTVVLPFLRVMYVHSVVTRTSSGRPLPSTTSVLISPCCAMRFTVVWTGSIRRPPTSCSSWRVLPRWVRVAVSGSMLVR